MVTQGLLSDADLKARLKGLTSEQKQVVLKEQNYIEPVPKYAARTLRVCEQSGFRDRPQGRAKISSTFNLHWPL